MTIPRPVVTAALLVLLPAITGLASVLWSKMAKVSPYLASSSNLAVSIGAILALAAVRHAGMLKTQAVVGQTQIVVVLVAYITLSIAISLMWLVALERTSLPIISLMEIGYPLFIVLFTALLVEPVRLNAAELTGGAMIVTGAGLVLWGGGRA